MEKQKNEKVIIEGQNYKPYIILVIGLIIAVISFAYSIWWNSVQYDPGDLYGFGHDANMTFFEHGMEYGYFVPFLYGGIPVLIIACILYWAISTHTITVTDKRVVGKTFFGKRVDLPIDKISAVSSVRLINGVGVATSSGVIRFALLRNEAEIIEVLAALLIERQDKSMDRRQNNQIGDLKKWKELFDEGVITQEEYEAKKKEYLGL